MQKDSNYSNKPDHIFLSGLLVFMLSLAGCGDNPESKAAKEVRSETQSAVQASVADRNYKDSRRKIVNTLVQKRTTGMTEDSALLASGNLAFANGCQMQVDLGMKRLPLHGSLDKFEKQLRDARNLFVEKNKLKILLSAGDQEVVELKQLIDGGGENPALTKQLQQFNGQMESLQTQKTALEQKQKQIQGALDDCQSRSDGLLRKAELAEGDQKLSLQQQAYGLLKQRKDDYIEVQSVEDQIDVLNSDIDLLKTRIEGTQKSIDDARARIKEVESSDTRKMLQGQVQDVEQAISADQQKLTNLAAEINEGYRSYQDLAEQVRSVFKDAIGEYEKIRSQEVSYTAALGQAKSAYQAAMTGQQQIRTWKYLSDRLGELMDTSGANGTADSESGAYVSEIKTHFAIPAKLQGDLQKEVFELFDESIAAYDQAASRVQRLVGLDPAKRKDAQCSTVKSKMLALYSKMKLADFLSDYDLATETEKALDQVIQQGTELGDCFTQSEALQIVQSKGLNYMPVIPLNMQVFIEGKKQELQNWKQLPVSEREAAVDKNLQSIDDLTQQYGQDFARQLEPIKQEMLDAKKGGFKESGQGGVGEPNSLN